MKKKKSYHQTEIGGLQESFKTDAHKSKTDRDMSAKHVSSREIMLKSMTNLQRV